jgi:putative endonuclease
LGFFIFTNFFQNDSKESYNYKFEITMSFFVYVLESNVDGRLYKGHTQDIEKRLNEHNAGKTKSTKGYLPWNLVYFEEFDTRENAVFREKYFKSGIGREFLKNKLEK